MRYALKHCEQIPSKTDGTITYRGKCVMTGKEYSVTVPTLGLMKYLDGALIQDAFPTLSVDDREFLMSGISPKYDWDAMGKQDD